MQDIQMSAKTHLDFAGLGELKARARLDQKDAAQEVGRQFEAMFIQMIFKSMRQANEPLKGDLMQSSGGDSFEQMYHQELSQTMSQTGLFGLGDWLSNQVVGPTNVAKAVKAYEQGGFVIPTREAAPMPLNTMAIRQLKGQSDG